MINIYNDLIKLNYTKKEAFSLAKKIKNLQNQCTINDYMLLRDKIMANLTNKFKGLNDDFI
jgi:hypothetical protein